jgi:hypothetical protein
LESNRGLQIPVANGLSDYLYNPYRTYYGIRKNTFKRNLVKFYLNARKMHESFDCAPVHLSWGSLDLKLHSYFHT